MASNNLHLDGLVSYAGYLNACGWSIFPNEDTEICIRKSAENDRFKWAKAQVFCRIFALFEAAILMITNGVRQTVRGSVSLASGLLTCDAKLIKFGLTDYLSVLVQTIALPLIGLMTIFSPADAARVARAFYREQNGEMRVMSVKGKADIFPVFVAFQPSLHEKNFLAVILLRATAPIQTVAYLVEGLASTLFSFNCNQRVLLAPCLLVYLPLRALIDEKSNPAVGDVHGLRKQVPGLA